MAGLFKRQKVITFIQSLVFKGNNSKVPSGIMMVIKLAQDILDINIFSKFGEDWMKTVQLREWTPLWLDCSKTQK